MSAFNLRCCAIIILNDNIFYPILIVSSLITFAFTFNILQLCVAIGFLLRHGQFGGSLQGS